VAAETDKRLDKVDVLVAKLKGVDPALVKEALEKAIGEQAAKMVIEQMTLDENRRKVVGEELVSQALEKRGIQKLTLAERVEYFRFKLLGEAPTSPIVKQALTDTVGSSGGSLIPADQRLEIYAAAAERSKIWSLCDVNATSGRTVEAPFVVVGDVNVGTDAKSSSATRSDKLGETAVTTSTKTFVLQDTDAYVPFKRSFVANDPIAAYTKLIAMIKQQFVIKRDYMILRGAGHTSSQVPGIIGTVGVPSTGLSANVVLKDVLALSFGIPTAYRDMGSLHAITNGKVLKAIVYDLAKNFVNAQALNAVLPIFVECGSMTNDTLLVGQFKEYAIYYREDMDMMVTQDASSRAIDVSVQDSYDGQVINPLAFNIYTSVAYAIA